MLYSVSLSVIMTISSLYTAVKKASSIRNALKIKPITNPLLNMAIRLMCVYLQPQKHLHSSCQSGILSLMVLPFNTSGTFCNLITALEVLSLANSNQRIHEPEMIGIWWY